MHKIIGIELISACNLKCRMCPCYEHFTGEKLPEEAVLQIFEGISKYNANVDRHRNGIHIIRFDGNNEPLLIPDIAALVKIAKK